MEKRCKICKKILVGNKKLLCSSCKRNVCKIVKPVILTAGGIYLNNEINKYITGKININK